MVKEVKKKDRDFFYLTIIDYIKNGSNPAKICSDLDISKQNLNYYISPLKKQGLIENIGYGVWKYHSEKEVKEGSKNLRGVHIPKPMSQESNKWRYHSLELEIRPYYFSKKYYKLLETRGGHSIKIGNWKYVLYYKKIIIWLEAFKDFESTNKEESIRFCNLDFNKILPKIENDTGAKIIKDRRSSIKLLKHHLAYTNAPEWEVVTEKDVFITFKDNGKVWLQYDRSKGINEREYVSKECVDYSDNLERQLNELKKPETPTNTEMMKFLIQERTLFAKDLREHNKLLKNINKAANKLNKMAKEKERYKADQQQKSLKKWC